MTAVKRIGGAGHVDRQKQLFDDVVGRTIRKARVEAGLTQPELAKRCGVALSALINAEDGHSCSAFLLALIAEELDTSVDALIPTEATSWRS